MRTNKQKVYAQNFLAKAHLAAELIRASSINQHDIVYEIGAGKGRLTVELTKQAKKVIAIEKDQNLYMELQKRLFFCHNIALYNEDFLKFNIKERTYKIFANLPFNITSAIMRKIIDEEHPPVEAYLIMQKEAAERFTGAGKTTKVSVLAKPWFKLRIIRHFKRTDFCPMPKADVVMLHIEKTKHPLISPSQKSMYERFVKHGFAAWKKNLRSTYKKTFTNNQWKRLAHDLEFPVRAKPSELRFSQWLGLFEFLIIHKYQQSTDKKSNNPDPLTGSTARS